MRKKRLTKYSVTQVERWRVCSVECIREKALRTKNRWTPLPKSWAMKAKTGGRECWRGAQGDTALRLALRCRVVRECRAVAFPAGSWRSGRWSCVLALKPSASRFLPEDADSVDFNDFVRDAALGAELINGFAASLHHPVIVDDDIAAGRYPGVQVGKCIHG